MIKNTALHLLTGKLITTSLLPGSLFMVSGVLIWSIWQKQKHLQNDTAELRSEVKKIKEQMDKLDASIETNQKQKAPDSSLLQEDHSIKESDEKKMGLFEYLINDNVKLRQQAYGNSD